MKRLSIAAVIAGSLALVLSACGTKRETGALAGAGVGAAAGAAVGDTTGALVGALVGGVVGHEVGRHLDERDEERIVQTLERNPTGEPTSWVNPDSGYQYEVTPTGTFDSYQGMEGPCREFEMDIFVEGRVEQGQGVACRQPDGTWQIVGT